MFSQQRWTPLLAGLHCAPLYLLCRMMRGILLLSMSLFGAAVAVGAENRPNVVLILADDMGVEAVGAYGGQSYATPQLDRLAAEGVRFTNAHAQPLCTPSRVQLMTGRYNFRNYQHFMHLDPAEPVFSQALQAAGYRTLVAGKWQLVNNGFEDITGAYPHQAGFDEYVLWQVEREGAGSRYWGPTIDDNGTRRTLPDSAFGPDVFNQTVLEFIERNRERPFLVYYTMVLPHLPLVKTPDSLRATTDSEQFAGMVTYMDKLVGKVREKLEALGLADNTLVLFISDNGTDTRIRSLRNGVWVQGGKGKTTDAGTHVPFIAWSPGLVAGGRDVEALVNLNDFFPTLLEVTGAKPPPNWEGDGSSLLPLLKGEGGHWRTEQFVHYDPRWFKKPARYIFDDSWKLYESGKFFHLTNDPLEQRPLSDASLDAALAKRKARWEQVLANTPGGPVPFWPTAPVSVYWVVGGAGFLILLAVISITYYLAWALRRRGRRDMPRQVKE